MLCDVVAAVGDVVALAYEIVLVIVVTVYEPLSLLNRQVYANSWLLEYHGLIIMP